MSIDSIVVKPGDPCEMRARMIDALEFAKDLILNL